MRKKSVLLRFAAASAIVLSTVAVTLPASAAPSHNVSISAHTARLSPASSTGERLCTTNGVFCLQRITSVENGSAYVAVWADNITWTGWFELRGPDGHIANSPNRTWDRGGVPEWLRDIPAGGGYTVIAWQDPSSPFSIGQIPFSV
jgi:hypothetical protein